MMTFIRTSRLSTKNSLSLVSHVERRKQGSREAGALHAEWTRGSRDSVGRDVVIRFVKGNRDLVVVIRFQRQSWLGGWGSNHKQEEGPEGDAVVTHSEPPEVRPSRTLGPVAFHALIHEEHVELHNLREGGTSDFAQS